ncbi:MAG TPA: NAD(P)H-hydrate epimerase, partial [Usitatibacter sp.]|nr:NAD(P)H-hydrate epimerase [Usitatibacter sp.]
MERAGRAIAERARALAADTGAPILVVAGPGNNGGDGWVAAALLRETFHRVVVLDVAGTEPRAPEARAAKAAFSARGGEIVRDWPQARPALVIDGLLGIGLARDVDPGYSAVIERMNAAAGPVLAIDIPSGLDSDTGRVRGACVRATHTITFIALKPGLLTGEGPERCGSVEIEALGTGEASSAAAPGVDLGPADVKGWLAPRARDSHKGTFGTMAIIGGNRGMVGAALLAGRAALHCGAGKVFVGLLAPDGPTVDLAQPELMLRPVDDALTAQVLVV